jgi:hypothetical protein
VCVHNVSAICWSAEESDFDDSSSNAGRRQLYPVGHIAVHSGYRSSSFTHANDIAVLTTRDQMTFDSCVSPVCLCDDRMTSSVTQFVATGWGTIAVRGNMTYGCMTMALAVDHSK